MRRALGVAGLVCPLLLCNCHLNDDYQDVDPPWWILNVYAVEVSNESPPPPVEGCPHVFWRILPDGEEQDSRCTEGNRVKIWGHIDATFSIEFRVTCAGYTNSNRMLVVLDTEAIRTRPGRKGPEVEENRTVVLVR